MNIPFLDLAKQSSGLKKQILNSFSDIISNSSFILGEEVSDFEDEFAKFLGVGHCVGVASGTDALTLAFQALGITKDDEVIIPANTFVATALAVVRTGAKPVLVDVSPTDYLIDYDLIETAITPRTKALCPVHLYGRSCNMERIRAIADKHFLGLVEDASQAHGAMSGKARVGGIGDIGCFSFYPGKNLGAFGDGGAVTTNSLELMNKLKALRNYGSENKYEYPVIGYNSRLDSLQAAVVRHKLKYLDGWNQSRYQIAKRYFAGFKKLVDSGDIRVAHLGKAEEHVYHLFVLETRRRNELRDFLHNKGIDTGIHYPRPFHLEPAYSFLGYQPGDFPETERLSSEIVSLPIYAELQERQVAYVIEQVHSFFGSCI